MALEGFLQEFGLADIMQLVYFQKKTGVLNIEGRKDKITISFKDGNVASLETRSRIEEKRIGRILMKRGFINQEELQSALDIQKKEACRLGSIFVKHGQISQDIVIEVVEEQIIDTIIQILSWKEGRYEFVPHEISVDRDVGISLDTQHLLMEGVRIVDELSVIDGKIEFDAIYRQIQEPQPEQFTEIQQEILNLIDGESDVSTIISVSPYEDFETAKEILSLEEQGVIDAISTVPVKKAVQKSQGTLKIPFYLMLLAVFLIVLAFIAKGELRAFNILKDARIRMNMERLKTEIEIFKAVNGQYPETIAGFEKEAKLSKNNIIYRKKESGFILFSAGPDGREGTNDDVY
jgi:hypothetical protein